MYTFWSFLPLDVRLSRLVRRPFQMFALASCYGRPFRDRLMGEWSLTSHSALNRSFQGRVSTGNRLRCYCQLTRFDSFTPRLSQTGAQSCRSIDRILYMYMQLCRCYSFPTTRPLSRIFQKIRLAEPYFRLISGLAEFFRKLRNLAENTAEHHKIGQQDRQIETIKFKI